MALRGCCRGNRAVCCLGVLTGVFLALGVLLLGGGDSIARLYIQTQLPLDDPTRLVFKIWADTAYEGTTVVRKFYFYSVTNPEAVLDNQSRPDVRTVGPYVYREHQWNPYESMFYAPDGTIGYTYHDTLTFAPDLSIDQNGNQLSDQDLIVTVNFPFLALLHRLKVYPDKKIRTAGCEMVDALFADAPAVAPTGLFVARTVNELFFGYDDPLFAAFNFGSAILVLAKKMKEPYLIPTRFNYLFNGSLPGPSPWTTLGGQRCPVWDNVDECNRSTANITRAWTGAGWGVPLPKDPTVSQEQYDDATWEDAPLPRGVEYVGSIMDWANNTRMWWWGSQDEYGGDCQRFEGGTGMTYPVRMDVNGRPYVYIDSMYRKMRLVYQRDATVKGIPVKRFVIDPAETDFSANSRCYFQEYQGLFNITPVVFAPLVISGNGFVNYNFSQRLKAPAFAYEGDQRLALNITINGMDPELLARANVEELSTFLDVYNDAGMLLHGAARLQSNAWLQPPNIDGCEGNFQKLRPRPIVNTTTGNVTGYSYFPETLFPVFTISREATLSDVVADYVRSHALLAFTLLHAFGGAFIGLAAVSLIAGGVVYTRNSRKHAVAAAAICVPVNDGGLTPRDGQTRPEDMAAFVNRGENFVLRRRTMDTDHRRF